MLRFGFELGCRPLRPAFLLSQQNSSFRPTTLCSSVPPLFQSRSYAKEGQELKKVKYNEGKKGGKVAKRRFKSGTRLKRTDWLDTPRKVPGMVKSKVETHHKFFTLNTDKRITKYVNKLKESTGKDPYVKWYTRLAHQAKISPENAATLTDAFLNATNIKAKRLTPKTYASFLDLWYRLKDVTRAKQVFDAMVAQGKVSDASYAIFAKTLATRGHLDKAKELLAERDSIEMEGTKTYKTMINYLAAANLNDGVQLLEKLKTRTANSEIQEHKPDREQFSTIIGWALKHGDLQVAEKYYQENKALYLSQTYTPYKDEAEYEARLNEFNQIQQQRHTLLSEWGKNLRQSNNSNKDNITMRDIQKLLHKPETKKPNLPTLPIYPYRYTEEEFLEKFPVPLSAHLLRPLIDIEQAGQAIPAEWVARLNQGLKWKKAIKDMKGLAHKIFLKDKDRYAHLKTVLTKLNLPSEDLTYIPPPRVKGKAPISKRKKIPVVTKWWKKDRTVFEPKD